jgi:hypothetical protein
MGLPPVYPIQGFGRSLCFGAWLVRPGYSIQGRKGPKSSLGFKTDPRDAPQSITTPVTLAPAGGGRLRLPRREKGEGGDMLPAQCPTAQAVRKQDRRRM